MKRSEMIEIILSYGPAGIFEEDADHLLQKMEEAGMLPPFNDLFYTSNIPMDTPFEWEPEDE